MFLAGASHCTAICLAVTPYYIIVKAQLSWVEISSNEPVIQPQSWGILHGLRSFPLLYLVVDMKTVAADAGAEHGSQYRLYYLSISRLLSNFPLNKMGKTSSL